ncbi:MAG: nucleotidyltransferase domain-containing protein [Bacteroidetes bacterium]|nr:nucleotidyltransferase domain-containing protein [Bacteroidota bacterium]
MNLTTKQRDLIIAYCRTQPILRMFLFGSMAEGNATKDSDIDILVELDYSQPIGLEFIQMQIDLQNLLNKKVDLVSARGLSEFIKPSIDVNKKLIYAR